MEGQTGTDSYSFFQLNLNNFEGPIDLLLHLVKRNELEITELSLAEICHQYLECIDLMKNLDLEIAGEYLVIAATLLSIKSSLLLNKPVELVEDEEGNLVDPHQELLQRLREAEIYKDGAREIAKMDYLELDVFAPPSKLKKYKSVDVGLAEHDAYLLSKAFWKALKQLDDQKVYQVVLESVSILDRMNAVLDRLNQAGDKIEFYNLLDDIKDKAMLIGTFLALLELCKRQVISVYQGTSEDQILISLADAEDFDLSSEFDEELDKEVVND